MQPSVAKRQTRLLSPPPTRTALSILAHRAAPPLLHVLLLRCCPALPCLPFAFALLSSSPTPPRRRHSAVLFSRRNPSLASAHHPPRAAAMDEDRGDSARRRLLSPPGGQGQSPRAATDLFSQFQRRLSQSLFLPPMAPRLPSAASGSAGSAFSYYQGTPALALAASSGGSHLTRSLSQPPLYSTDQLAPLPYAGLAAGSGAEQGGPPPLPPRGAGHRRSQSDFLLGFSHPNMSLSVPPSVDAAALDSVFGSYRVMGTLGSVVDGADHAIGWSPADSNDNEVENWAASGVRQSNPRHCRSLSVDSFMGNLDFRAMGQESPRLPPPSLALAAGTSRGLSRSGSGPSDGPSALFATTDLANGEFNADERKKIMASDHLAAMALSDPKRVKRFDSSWRPSGRFQIGLNAKKFVFFMHNL